MSIDSVSVFNVNLFKNIIILLNIVVAISVLVWEYIHIYPHQLSEFSIQNTLHLVTSSLFVVNSLINLDLMVSYQGQKTENHPFIYFFSVLMNTLSLANTKELFYLYKVIHSLVTYFLLTEISCYVQTGGCLFSKKKQRTSCFWRWHNLFRLSDKQALKKFSAARMAILMILTTIYSVFNLVFWMKVDLFFNYKWIGLDYATVFVWYVILLCAFFDLKYGLSRKTPGFHLSMTIASTLFLISFCFLATGVYITHFTKTHVNYLLLYVSFNTGVFILLGCFQTIDRYSLTDDY